MIHRRQVLAAAAAGSCATVLARPAAAARTSASGTHTRGDRMSVVSTADGVRLHVFDQNPPDAQATLLMVHGWPANARMFEHQYADLPSKKVRCVGVDLRGFGQSDKPWAGLGYDAWADDIRAVIDSLALRNVTLAGFSMGGAVALHYFDRHGGHGVNRLALLGAAGPCLGRRTDNPTGIPRDVHDGFVAAARSDRAKLNADFGKALFHQPVSPDYDRFFWSMGMDASVQATIRGVEELRDRDLRPTLGRIAVPTMICHGVHDQVIPIALGAEVQARLIPGAQLLPFEQSGHGLFHDERDKLNEELLRFVV